MKLFQLLQGINPGDCKIHLAVVNQFGDNPLDRYLAGTFKQWQEWQGRQNFERKYIVSLIQLYPGADHWLYGGLFKSHGAKPGITPRGHEALRYRTTEVDKFNEFVGRLVVSYKRTGRQSYRNAETMADEISMVEYKPKRMVVEAFPGYSHVLLNNANLNIVVDQAIGSWKAALSSVSGVYLITDTMTGKHYVGSATGEDNIWQRWSAYAKNGHGGNKDLRKLLADKGSDYAYNFQYSVLEIADTHASRNDVLDRESHWKEVLCSRLHGYNRN